MPTESGMPAAFGFGVPAKRLIQIWSPHSEVVERAVDRAEEGAARLLALRIAQAVGGAVEVLRFCQRL